MYNVVFILFLVDVDWDDIVVFIGDDSWKIVNMR